MELRLLRYNHDEESTQGLLAINNDGNGHKDAEFECHTLEDQRQDVKVVGKTRIPEGEYEIGFQEQITPLTNKYRKKYAPWFDKHLHIKNIPEFTGVYIHVGNNDKHTMGCLLVADRAYNDPNDFNAYQANSADAFERLYAIVSRALNNGEKVTLVIKSIWENK